MSTINVKVVRYNPEEDRKYEEEFKVPFTKGMTVQMVLDYLEGTNSVAYRHSCDIGLCAICSMIINCKKQLACTVVLEEPQDLVIEPRRNRKVYRDLVTEFSRNEAENVDS